MTAADIPAALALWASAEGVSIAEGDSPDELSAYLERNPRASQVAYKSGTLIGAVLAGQDGRRGFLYHLAVAPSSRGLGHGKELVGRSLSALETAGVRRVLILVARDNEEGRAFWLHCGWERMDFAEPFGIDL